MARHRLAASRRVVSHHGIAEDGTTGSSARPNEALVRTGATRLREKRAARHALPSFVDPEHPTERNTGPISLTALLRELEKEDSRAP